MNRMQKMAWVGLAGFLISDILFALYFIIMFIPRPHPVRGILGFGLTSIFLGGLAILLWKFRNPQSLMEPERDERDLTINRRAITVGFVTLCILLLVSSVGILAGFGEQMPTSVFPLVQLSIFMTAMTVYYATIPILYGRHNLSQGETK
jgi:hypothetical protein